LSVLSSPVFEKQTAQALYAPARQTIEEDYPQKSELLLNQSANRLLADVVPYSTCRTGFLWEQMERDKRYYYSSPTQKA
jgi:hypothetical protein